MKNRRPIVFCEVMMLNGRRRVYRFPNDLQSALLDYGSSEDLNDLLSNALINVPTKEIFKSNSYKPILHVAKIDKVFISRDCKVSRRTRGQFLTNYFWTEKSVNVSFLLHDHSVCNKIRIFIDVLRWRSKRKRINVEKV